MLYNFMDTPSDLYERMRLNITLNEELGVRIWSFPMRYQPVNLKNRSHVGKNWTKYQLRSFQIMLQATRGVVSGNPSFFMRAYGEDKHDFERLLSLPHAFIFHRDYYEKGAGRPVRDDYDAARRRLSKSQGQELIALLSGSDDVPGFRKDRLRALATDRSIDTSLRRVIEFHLLNTNEKPQSNLLPLFPRLNPDPALPDDDELVEDAGLFDHDHALEQQGKVVERDHHGQ